MKRFIKKLLILTVIAAMIVTALPFAEFDVFDLITTKVYAEEEDVSQSEFVWGDYICNGYDYPDGITITKYTGSDSEVVIPSKINGKPVVFINEYAFSPAVDTNSEGAIIEYPDCNNLVSVTVPSTVVEIGFRAFFICQNLECVTLSEGLKYIGERAFEDCVKLKNIDLPSTLITIEDSAFNLTAIEELVIKDNPESAFLLGGCCFYGSSIKKLIVQDDDVEVLYDTFTKSVIEEVIFEGDVAKFFDDALSQENTVKKIVFKAAFPAELIDILRTDFGYYYHENHEDGSVWFDKTPTNSEYSDPIVVPGMCEYVLDENSNAIITKYIGYYTDVLMPDEIEGHKIVELADGSFANYSAVSPETGETIYIKKVGIPTTVKKIGTSAFEGNTKLTELNIPEGVEEIGFAAFKGCTALATAEIADSVKYISSYAFYGCSALTEVSLRGADTIGIMAFMNCKKLASITLPESMTDIGASAFKDCTALKSCIIPEGIKTVKEETFSGCKYISKVVLPATIESIASYAFKNCTNLKTIENTKYITKLNDYSFYCCGLNSFDFSSEITEIPEYCFYGAGFVDLVIPSTVETVKSFAFSGLTSLDNLIISEGVKNLEDSSFHKSGEYTLTMPSTVEDIQPHVFSYGTINDLVIPEGVKFIRVYAFAHCKIKNLTIPETMERIEYGAFNYSGCSVLNYNAVNCKTCFGSFSQSVSSGYLGISGVNKIEIGDKVESIPDYLCDENNIKTLIIPEGVKSIGRCAFRGVFYTALTSVSLPSTLESVGEYAFAKAEKLTEFTIPESVTKFSAKAFYECNSLETLYINARNCEFTDLTVGDDGIGQSPFYNRKSIKKIVFGDTVEQIPNNMFAKMVREIECVIPDTIKDIGEYAFYSCTKLTEFNFPSGLESIGAYAFARCTALQSIELPDTLKIIDSFAFKSCTKVENLILPDSVIFLGEGVFGNCYNLKSFVFGDSINAVPAGLFEGCRSLEDVYISDSVVRLDEKAFYQCCSLKSVRMSPNVDYIPREAFYACTALTTFIWEADSKLIGRLAFANCKNLTQFDFVNLEKLYVNSFSGSGVSVVNLGETAVEESQTPLTTVETQSFMDCENLETVGIGGSVSTVKKMAFANCSNLETAVISDNVTDIADDAFDGCDNLTIYCNENSYAYTYATTQGINVSTFVIAPIPNQTYTGYAIKPDVSVSLSGNKLTESIDFGVTYSDNIDVGTADVVVKGKGDFKMFTSRANFAIVSKNISGASVLPVAEQSYTGEEIVPSVTVSDGLNILKENKDYTLGYSNNIEQGTAKIKIMGIGNYYGSLETEFNIVKKNISSAFLIPISDQMYTGSAITPVVYLIDGGVLQEDVDYTVLYSENIEAGTAKITVTGIGKYSGSIQTEFKILKAEEEPSVIEKIISFFSRIFWVVGAFLASVFKF